jgi:hypothetical protein
LDRVAVAASAGAVTHSTVSSNLRPIETLMANVTNPGAVVVKHRLADLIPGNVLRRPDFR